MFKQKLSFFDQDSSTNTKCDNRSKQEKVITIPLTIPLVRIDENEVMNPNLSEDIIENETFNKLSEDVTCEDNSEGSTTKCRYLCTNCKLPFKGTKEYRKHIEETHKVEDGYKCDQCLKVKSTRQLWMHHCVVHHREKERVAKTKPVIHDATIQKEKLFL